MSNCLAVYLAVYSVLQLMYLLPTHLVVWVHIKLLIHLSCSLHIWQSSSLASILLLGHLSVNLLVCTGVCSVGCLSAWSDCSISCISECISGCLPTCLA